MTRELPPSATYSHANETSSEYLVNRLGCRNTCGTKKGLLEFRVFATTSLREFKQIDGGIRTFTNTVRKLIVNELIDRDDVVQ